MDVQQAAYETYPGNLATVTLQDAKALLLDLGHQPLCPEKRNTVFYSCLRDLDEEAVQLVEFILDVAKADSKSLLDARDMYGQTCFFYAARKGHILVCQHLLKTHSMDIDPIDHTQQSPLFYVARDGHCELIHWLLQNGAEIDRVDCNGDTPLFYAARDGRTDAVAAMIERGADCSYRNRSRRYASTIAKLMGHRKLAALLESARKGAETRGSSLPESRRKRGKFEAAPAASSKKRASKKVQKDSSEEESGRELCSLQFRSPTNTWGHVPIFKVKEFEAVFPHIAIWDQEVNLPPLTLEGDTYRAEWHRLAQELMRYLTNDVESAAVFKEPVDPKKWGIPDYFDIVKQPMDFGTIQTRLEVGVEYRSIEDFTKDLEKVFYNCVLYNSATSEVGRVAIAVREAALAYSKSIGLFQMSEEENVVRDESLGIVEQILRSRDQMALDSKSDLLMADESEECCLLTTESEGFIKKEDGRSSPATTAGGSDDEEFCRHEDNWSHNEIHLSV